MWKREGRVRGEGCGVSNGLVDDLVWENDEAYRRERGNDRGRAGVNVSTTMEVKWREGMRGTREGGMEPMMCEGESVVAARSKRVETRMRNGR